MVENNIIYDQINEKLNNNFINKLGKKYGDKSNFIIKTHRITFKLLSTWDADGNRETEKVDEYNTMFLEIHKCINGFIGTINGHFSTDYHDYVITNIAKINL